jgi:alcohol dehydrogenase
VGDRAAVGWFGKHCHECKPCRQGDFICCENQETTALQFDGGYQEYVNVPQEAVAKVPEGMDFKQAAPMMCAGEVLASFPNSVARATEVCSSSHVRIIFCVCY